MLKIWSLVTITPVFAAIIIRIGWELAVNYSYSGLLMSVLVVAGILGVYGLIFYLILKPDRKILTCLPIWIGFAGLTTGSVIAAIIHFTRFINSPNSELPWSLVIALLYSFAMFSAYVMVLWFTWSLWKKGQRKE